MVLDETRIGREKKSKWKEMGKEMGCTKNTAEDTEGWNRLKETRMVLEETRIGKKNKKWKEMGKEME